MSVSDMGSGGLPSVWAGMLGPDSATDAPSTPWGRFGVRIGARCGAGRQVQTMTQPQVTQQHASDATFKTGDVARVLSLSPRGVRRMVYAGFLHPRKGRRGEYRFSFQDIVFLRTSQRLLESGISRRRIRYSLQRIVRQMPRGRPVTSARIWAEGERILARHGRETWVPESGQILLNFGNAAPVPPVERIGA